MMGWRKRLKCGGWEVRPAPTAPRSHHAPTTTLPPPPATTRRTLAMASLMRLPMSVLPPADTHATLARSLSVWTCGQARREERWGGEVGRRGGWREGRRWEEKRRWGGEEVVGRWREGVHARFVLPQWSAAATAALEALG